MKRIHTTYGFTMLPLILFLFVIVGLVSAGYMMLGPKVQLGKTVETKAGLEKAVDAIISWSVANGHLPGTPAEFTSTSINQFDSWGRRVRYLYDKNLIATSNTNTICNYTSTGLTINGTSNIAFALMSFGDDNTPQSTWNGTLFVNDDTNPNYMYPLHDGVNAATNTALLVSPDLFRVVTLEVLKNRAGCYGATQGRLKILNNELPSVCDGSSTYSAKLVAEGGVSGATYTWSTQNAPDWLACDPSSTKACNDPLQTFTGQSLPLSVKLGKTASEEPGISFTLKDSVNPPVSRLLPIRKSTSSACISSPPGGSSNFNNIATDFSKTEGVGNNITINSDKTINLGSGHFNGTYGYGCIWDNTNKTLLNHTLRTYFVFKTNNDTSANSTSYGDGFTFAIMQGANPVSVCGGAGEALGYGARDGHSIPGDSIAIEFDTYPNGSQSDPTNYNHIAVVKGGSVHHNGFGSATLGPNPSCTGASHPGCSYTSQTTWLEDNISHPVRIDVLTGCDSSCSSCGGTGGYALIKAWVNCSGATCSDLSANYAATPPNVTHCFIQPTSMNNVKIGFTEATWGASQSTIISNFAAGFY